MPRCDAAGRVQRGEERRQTSFVDFRRAMQGDPEPGDERRGKEETGDGEHRVRVPGRAEMEQRAGEVKQREPGEGE